MSNGGTWGSSHSCPPLQQQRRLELRRRLVEPSFADYGGLRHRPHDDRLAPWREDLERVDTWRDHRFYRGDPAFVMPSPKLAADPVRPGGHPWAPFRFLGPAPVSRAVAFEIRLPRDERD